MGKTENLIIVLIIVLVLFGSKRIPELARSIGQSIKEVRNGLKDDSEPAKASRTSSESETEA